jgi:hypothetical protein
VVAWFPGGPCYLRTATSGQARLSGVEAAGLGSRHSGEPRPQIVPERAGRAAAVRFDQRLTNAPGLPPRGMLLGFSSRSRASAFSLGLSSHSGWFLRSSISRSTEFVTLRAAPVMKCFDMFVPYQLDCDPWCLPQLPLNVLMDRALLQRQRLLHCRCDRLPLHIRGFERAEPDGGVRAALATVATAVLACSARDVGAHSP